MVRSVLFTNKRPQIIMVLPSWQQRCGISEYTRSLTDALKNEGCNVEVVKDILLLLEKGDITEEKIIHLQYEYSLFTYPVIQKIITHLHSKNIPFLITAHSYTQELAVYNNLLKEIKPLIVHNTHIAKKMSCDGWNSKNLRVIPMGVDDIYQHSNSSKGRQELKISGDPCIGFFGFMHWYKGILHLLEAVDIIKKHKPLVKCYMFSSLSENEGSQKFYKLFQTKLKKLKINNNIYLNTEYLPKEELIKHLSLMDVNILPYVDSNYYASSAAVRMLLSAGKPVITSNSNFFADLQDGVYKINEVSSQCIADAICYVHNNLELQESLLKKGENHVKSHPWKVCAQQHIGIYEEVFKQK